MTPPTLAALLLAALLALHAAAAASAGIPQPAQPFTPVLGDPPVAPAISEPPAPRLGAQSFPAAGLVMDTQDRESVRIFYRGLFFQPGGDAMGWTGNYSTGAAGTTNQAFRDAVAMRVNWHRAMAGVPANISFNATFTDKDQQAALMMSANNQLNHFPPNTWTYYTAGGAEAAQKSNLSLGRFGADSVTSGYIKDNGANNTPVGHRRWILYPQTQLMGTGDVPGGTFNGGPVTTSNALWVLDGSFGSPRPPTRDDFVAWPPKGYVPYPVVFGRWSLSYPGADFANATVTLARNGVGVPVTIEHRSVSGGPNLGENTIVWIPSGFFDFSDWPRPVADENWSVNVANITGSGVPSSFSYEVKVFDPDVATPGAPVATVTVPATAATLSSFTASVAPMPGATGYQLDFYRSVALGGAMTPSNSGAQWTQATSSYNALEASEFHLYHAAFATQTLTLDKFLYVGAGASLAFNRRFGFTSATEIARVQASLDGGASWQDVDTEAGTGSTVPSASRTVGLAAFSGRIIRLRFAFTVSGSFFNCANNCGWYFSNVVLSNVSEATLTTSTALTAGQPSGSLVPPTPGNYVVVARTEYQGTYFGDFGPGAALQAVNEDLAAPTIPAGLTATATGGSQIHLSWGPSSDNVAVALYQVFRGGVFRATVSSPAAGMTDTGLAANTNYAYRIAACDASGNCSEQSAQASATTLAAGQFAIQAAAESGFNLLGNALAATLDVVALFGRLDAPNPGVTENVVSVWKWDAVLGRWAFHSPQLTAAGNASYAASRNYDVLSGIGPGEGYWINAIQPFTLPLQSGAGFNWTPANFSALVSGFSLIAQASSMTPGEFNTAVATPPPPPVPTDNFVSLWLWDAVLGKWYFYSPLLDAAGGPAAVKSYADSRNYLHFQDYNKTLGIGAGFWVNRP